MKLSLLVKKPQKYCDIIFCQYQTPLVSTKYALSINPLITENIWRNMWYCPEDYANRDKTCAAE